MYAIPPRGALAQAVFGDWISRYNHEAVEASKLSSETIAAKPMARQPALNCDNMTRVMLVISWTLHRRENGHSPSRFRKGFLA